MSGWVLAHDEMGPSEFKNVLLPFLGSDEFSSASRSDSVLESDVCHYCYLNSFKAETVIINIIAK